MYTSGTTGRPKGVMMNHAQTLRMFSEWCDLADLRKGDRYLVVNPFFHMFGYKAGLIASMIRGATVLPVPVLDVDEVLALVEREKVTMLPRAAHALPVAAVRIGRPRPVVPAGSGDRCRRHPPSN